MQRVATFAAGEFHLWAALRELVIGRQRARDERFFQPGRPGLFQSGNAHGSRFDVIAPHGAGVHEEQRTASETFARRPHMVGVNLDRAAAIRTPTKFTRAKTGAGDLLAGAKRFLWIIPEKLRGVGHLGIRPRVAQQPPDWFPEFFAQQIPKRDVNARQRVIRLQQVDALGTHEAR